MKKLTIMFIFIFITLFGLAYYDVNNSDCYKLPEKDARTMINAALKSKHEKSNKDTILFGYKYENIVYSSYDIFSGKKGDGFNSVNLIYNDKTTNKSMFKVSIFENCGLHWYDRKFKN